MERVKFHELINVGSETNMKDGFFFKAPLFMTFAASPLNLEVGAGLVKYFPNAN